MPSLEAYSRSLDYSYAPGLFPSMEALTKRPETVRRLLLSSQSGTSEGAAKLRALCEARHIRVEEADRALARISGKDNCFAAAVFDKFQGTFLPDIPHVVLHNPSDGGNVGTILRTCLGLGFKNVAIIRPATDVFDPRTVRASMGAIFSMQVREYDDFDAYRQENPERFLYPFMLDSSRLLEEATADIHRPYSLVFGNEGSGLPASFAAMGQAVRIPHSNEIDSLNLSIAAAIGVYAFKAADHAKD